MAELRLPYSVRDERGIATEALILRNAAIDPELVHVMDIDNVLADALPALAWQFDMLGPLWEALTTTADKRSYLKERYTLQGLRGTAACLEKALSYLGWTARVNEMQNALYHNGFITTRNGYYARNTAPSGWYGFFVEIDLEGGEYSAADHSAVMEVGQFYAPARSRLEHVTLKMEALSSTTGAEPSWSTLTKFGISADGVTWVTHPFRAHTTTGNSALIEWGLFCDSTPVEATHVALINADGSVFAQKTRALISKTSEVELFGTWTLTW